MKSFGTVCENRCIVIEKTLKNIYKLFNFKIMKKLLLLAIVVLGFSAVSFGQLTNSADANATASVFTALTIEKKADLAFGALGAKTIATIAVMNTDGSRTNSTANTMATNLGNVARFEVKGDANNPFTITFPSSDTPLEDGAKPDMNILAGGFVAKIDNAADGNSGTIAAGGTSIVKVGATLQVGANQPKGDYTGVFSVTVNYN